MEGTRAWTALGHREVPEIVPAAPLIGRPPLVLLATAAFSGRPHLSRDCRADQLGPAQWWERPVVGELHRGTSPYSVRNPKVLWPLSLTELAHAL